MPQATPARPLRVRELRGPGVVPGLKALKDLNQQLKPISVDVARVGPRRAPHIDADTKHDPIGCVGEDARNLQPIE